LVAAGKQGRRMNDSASSAALARCPWPKQDPLYIAYHDEEWGVPEYDDRALYEKLVLDGFQAGLSWITILRKRENFRRHRSQSRQDRRRGALRARLARGDGQGTGIFQTVMGLRRRAAEDQPLPQHKAGAGGDRDLARDVQGAFPARF